MGICALAPWSIATACSETDCELTQSCGVPSGKQLGGTGSLGDSGGAMSGGVAGASGRGATDTDRGGTGGDDPGPWAIAGASGSSGATGCAQDACGCDGLCPDEGWSKPILLENNDAKGFDYPKIGVGPRGDLVVAWQRDRSEAGGLWLNTYDPDLSTWRGAFDALGGDVDDLTGDPQVVFAPGEQALVYYRYVRNSGPREMRVHRFTPEPYGWSSTSISTAGDAGYTLRIAQNRSGRAAAHYRFVDEVRYSLVSHYDPASKAWSPWEMLTASSATYTTQPLTAIGESGHITYLWRYYQSGDEHIYAKTLDPVEGWRTTQLLDSGEYALPAGMSYSSDGSALGAWNLRDAANAPRTLEISWLSTTTGLWGPRITLSEPGEDVAAGSVTLDRSGNAFALWTSSMGDEAWVKVRRFDAASKQWSDALTLRREGYSTGLNLGTDDAGNAVAAWESRVDDIGHAYVARYDAASDHWTGATRIDTSSADISYLHLAVGNDGGAYTVWKQDSAGKPSIWFSMRPTQ